VQRIDGFFSFLEQLAALNEHYLNQLNPGTFLMPIFKSHFQILQQQLLKILFAKRTLLWSYL
jgi:hypothetical protein